MAKNIIKIKLYTDNSESINNNNILKIKYKNKNDFSIEISKKYLIIAYSPYRNIFPKDIFARPVIQNLIKKLFFCYIFLYGRNFISENNKTEVTYNNSPVEIDFFPVYSMIPSVVPNFSCSKKYIEEFIKLNDFESDKRFCTINNFLIAKSKSYEAEKFLYFWMSFNSYYSYIWKNSDNKSVKGTEEVKLNNLLQIKCNSSEVFSKDERNLVFEWIREFFFVKAEQLNQFLDNDFQNNIVFKEFFKTIEDYVFLKTGKRINGYFFILIEFCYAVRCKYFHGSKPLPIFCTQADNNWKMLEILNFILEDFLFKELPKIYE